MKTGKVIKWSVAGAATALLALLSGPCIHDTIVNDRQLSQMKRQLEKIPPPPSAERIASRSAVGLLVGNGNHCDFFVGSLFRTKEPREHVQEHYDRSRFLNPVTGNQEEIDVTVLTNAADLRARWLPDQFSYPEAWGVSASDFQKGTVFLVSIMRSYRPNYDWRTH